MTWQVTRWAAMGCLPRRVRACASPTSAGRFPGSHAFTPVGSMPGLGMSPHDAFAGAFLDEIADTKFEASCRRMCSLPLAPLLTRCGAIAQVPTVPLPQPRLPLAAAVAPSATVPASYSAHSAPIGIPGAPKAEPERPPMEYVPDHEPEGDVVGSSMEQQPKRYALPFAARPPGRPPALRSLREIRVHVCAFMVQVHWRVFSRGEAQAH